jgi:hypothetical protein
MLLVLMLACGSLAQTVLRQTDVQDGTLIIDQPGTYVLGEDIYFNPNPPSTTNDFASASRPYHHQYSYAGGKYDAAAYGLGFFAVISIVANDVTLDLNGHTLAMSETFALLQRFAAVIELANMPFIPRQGPADFGSGLQSAANVTIKNGIIGRSSHHGIHGNGNVNVVISNVEFVGYEVAAVALNGVKGAHLSDLTLTSHNRVPVLGTFSAARFIAVYLSYLAQTHPSLTLNLGGNAGMAVNAVLAQLLHSINNTYHDVIFGSGTIDASLHAAEHSLYANTDGIVDGNNYGIIINQMGVAVNGFPTYPTNEAVIAQDVLLENIVVHRQQGHIREVVALSRVGNPVIDPAGAVFQVFNVDDAGEPVTMTSLDPTLAEYRGNVVANAQAIVAKGHYAGFFTNSGLDTSRTGDFDDRVLSWIEAQPNTPEAKLGRLLAQDPPLCNGDSMFHVDKGTFGIAIFAARNVTLVDVTLEQVDNTGSLGSAACGNYSKSHPQAHLTGYGGSAARGFAFVGADNVICRGCLTKHVVSHHGRAVGVDVMTDSRRVHIEKCSLRGLQAGMDFAMGDVSVVNARPEAACVHIGADVDDVVLDDNAIFIPLYNIADQRDSDTIVVVPGNDMSASSQDSQSWDDSTVFGLVIGVALGVALLFGVLGIAFGSHRRKRVQTLDKASSSCSQPLSSASGQGVSQPARHWKEPLSTMV